MPSWEKQAQETRFHSQKCTVAFLPVTWPVKYVSAEELMRSGSLGPLALVCNWETKTPRVTQLLGGVCLKVTWEERVHLHSRDDSGPEHWATSWLARGQRRSY